MEKEVLVQKIIQIQDELREETDEQAAKEQFARKLADAFEAYLKSLTISITGTSNQGAFTGTGKIQ